MKAALLVFWTTTLMTLQSCSPESIGQLASFDCNTDITLNSGEKAACIEGIKLAIKVVNEAKLSVLSTNPQFLAATRRAEKLCDRKYTTNPQRQNACYVGLQYYRDEAISENEN